MAGSIRQYPKRCLRAPTDDLVPMATGISEEDGYSSISGATLQKAIEELNENPETRASIVQEFRAKIYIKERESKPTGDPIIYERKDGKFLLRFLRARKFNLDRAVQLYINYYKYKRKFRHLLMPFHPKHVSNVIDSGIFGVLKGTMKNNSRVLCVIPQRWDYLTVHPNDPYKTFIMILEKLVEDEEIQVHGISILDDMDGTSWHLTYAFVCSEQLQKGGLVELQDSFPIRFKGFHMLNPPWYLSMIMRVVRPFLSQKHRDRIRTHGDNYSELHEYIDPMYLPSNFGGEGSSLESDNLKTFFEEALFEHESSSSSRTVSISSGRE